MNIKDMRLKLGDTQGEFSKRYGIPFRTIQNWENGVRKPSKYVVDLIERQFNEDIQNRKTIKLPKYDSRKIDLPKREEYVGCISWLKAVNKALGKNVVFALDDALMCDGYFLGRNDEYLVYVYGDDSLTKFNGVVVLGNNINEYDIKTKNGLRYTNFDRTLNDSFSNETILDMQGITEAINRYYYLHNESFKDLNISLKHQTRFDQLLVEAISYYEA